MDTIDVKICAGYSCSQKLSAYIKVRLESDIDFYRYDTDRISVDFCPCQGRCKEWPIVVFDSDVHTHQNPVKSSQLLQKKLSRIQSSQ